MCAEKERKRDHTHRKREEDIETNIVGRDWVSERWIY